MKKKLISFNNKANAFIDVDTLPPSIAADEIYKLSKRNVVYKITVPNGMVYIGETNDIGERINTHIKCGRNIDNKLYNDIRKYGECTFSILDVCKTRDEALEVERKCIQGIEMCLLEEHYGKELPLVDDAERNGFLFGKIYNIKY